MSALLLARDMLDEGVAFADAASLRLRRRPLVVTPGTTRRRPRDTSASTAPTAKTASTERAPSARDPEDGDAPSSVAFLPAQTTQRGADQPSNSASASMPMASAFPIPFDGSKPVASLHRFGRLRLPTLRLGVAQLAMLAGVAVATTPPLLAMVRLAEVRATYGRIIADRAAIAVRMGPELAGVMRQPGADPDALVLPKHYSSDDALARMYQAAEGGGDRLTYFGLPIRSIVRATLCHLGVPIPGDCGGASGEIQHAIRGLRGGHGGDHDGTRKLHEFLDAPALSLAYPKGDARTTMIMNNLNFGYLPGGRPLIGVTNVSLALWGEPDPDKLSLTKKAAIWGLFKYPISWDDGRGISQKGIQARKNALNRARDVLVKTFGRNDPRLADAFRELDMPDFFPAHPVAPLTEVDGAVGTLASTELPQIAKTSGQAPITDIELTIPNPATLRRYEAGVVGALREMEGHHDFARPLTTGGDGRADGLAVVTANAGAITAIAATTPRIGLSSKLRAGSHGKWVVLLALSRTGLFDADSMLCNRALDGIQNAGGDTGVANCAAGRGLIPIRLVFGKSLNLPLLDATHRLNDVDLRTAAEASGFTLPTGERDPRRSLILGNAEADPASIIALGNALSSFANGGEAIGSFPHIIRRIRVGDGWVSPQQRRPLDLRTFLHGEKARRLVGAICAAPLNGGTLNALNEPAMRTGVQCGKSATVAGSKEDGYPTISKAIIVSGMAGTWYTYLGAPKGVLGTRTLSIIPLGKAAQGQPVTHSATQLSDN